MIPKTLKAPLGTYIYTSNVIIKIIGGSTYIGKQMSQKIVKLNKYLSRRRHNKSVAYNRRNDMESSLPNAPMRKMSNDFL